MSASYAFTPAPYPALPIAGSTELFPVHRVYCVGRNYAEHAREMGHDPNKEPPFFFQKNPDNLDCSGRFPYPPLSKDVQFEVELMVALSGGGSDIAAERASDLVFGYGIALDMTRRDLQGEAKKLGRPWEVGKAFEHSAPCTPITPRGRTGMLTRGAITLDVNGVRRQTGDLSQMIWDVPNQIAFLSRLFVLQPGDVILTGTPAGVGAVQPGDAMVGKVEGLAELRVSVV
jgi:fumarylpyruvate hydrolase